MIRSARSAWAIPVNKTWGAFEDRTRQGRLEPSSASAYVPRSSQQKSRSNSRRNLIRMIDDVISQFKGSLEIWPTLVEICYLHKNRAGLPMRAVENQRFPLPR